MTVTLRNYRKASLNSNLGPALEKARVLWAPPVLLMESRAFLLVTLWIYVHLHRAVFVCLKS